MQIILPFYKQNRSIIHTLHFETKYFNNRTCVDRMEWRRYLVLPVATFKSVEKCIRFLFHVLTPPHLRPSHATLFRKADVTSGELANREMKRTVNCVLLFVYAIDTNRLIHTPTFLNIRKIFF